jgi:hypothetical protein
MALTLEEQTWVARALRRLWSVLGAPQAWVKDHVLVVVAAVDQWCDDNQASYNAALPEPFRSSASAAMKATALAYVLWKRHGAKLPQED